MNERTENFSKEKKSMSNIDIFNNECFKNIIVKKTFWRRKNTAKHFEMVCLSYFKKRSHPPRGKEFEYEISFVFAKARSSN